MRKGYGLPCIFISLTVHWCYVETRICTHLNNVILWSTVRLELPVCKKNTPLCIPKYKKFYAESWIFRENMSITWLLMPCLFYLPIGSNSLTCLEQGLQLPALSSEKWWNLWCFCSFAFVIHWESLKLCMYTHNFGIAVPVQLTLS